MMTQSKAAHLATGDFIGSYPHYQQRADLATPVRRRPIAATREATEMPRSTQHLERERGPVRRASADRSDAAGDALQTYG